MGTSTLGLDPCAAQNEEMLPIEVDTRDSILGHFQAYFKHLFQESIPPKSIRIDHRLQTRRSPLLANS